MYKGRLGAQKWQKFYRGKNQERWVIKVEFYLDGRVCVYFVLFQEN